MAVSLTSSGLSMPASVSLSGDANTLDDYEEGTWTPAPANAGSYTVNGANYTKLGRLVNLCWKITYGSTFYPSPMNGAPFTCSQHSAGTVYEVGMLSNVATDNSVFDMIRFDSGGTSMEYHSWDRNSLGTPQADSGSYAFYQMTYETAS